MNGSVDRSNAVIHCLSFIGCQFFPCESPHILKGYQEFAPAIAKRRNKWIARQYISQGPETTPVAPSLDEFLNAAEELLIIFNHFSRSDSKNQKRPSLQTAHPQLR